jgi:hypothetical protein
MKPLLRLTHSRFVNFPNDFPEPVLVVFHQRIFIRETRTKTEGRFSGSTCTSEHRSLLAVASTSSTRHTQRERNVKVRPTTRVYPMLPGQKHTIVQSLSWQIARFSIKMAQKGTCSTP